MSDVQCDACDTWGYMSPGQEAPSGWKVVKETIAHEWRTFRYCREHEVIVCDPHKRDAPQA